MRVASLAPGLTVMAVLALPAAAVADRTATAKERTAIARAVGAPSRCQSIRVSTVDRAYAASTFKGTASCARYGTAGTDVLRRTKGRWTAVAGASGCTRPQHVPRRVWKDLLPASCG